MQRSVIWLGGEGLIDSCMTLIDVVLRGIYRNQTAQRVEVGAVDPERAVVEANRFVELVLCQSYRSKIDVYIGAAGRRTEGRQKILTGRFGVSQLQSRRAVGDQGVGPQIRQHLR